MGDQERLERLAWWMDERFRVPGTNRRVGLDGLLGLVPGVGDAVTTFVSAWIVAQAWRMGAPRHLILRMVANIAIDFGVGSVPVAGDVFDFAFKANRRNVRLLRKWLDARAGAPTTL